MTDTPPPPALTRSQKEEAIRAKCVEANPGITERVVAALAKSTAKTASHWQPDHTVIIDGYRPIRLADVLLAYQPLIEKLIPHDPVLRAFKTEALIDYWDLRQDDLSKVSDTGIDFLFDLLP